MQLPQLIRIRWAVRLTLFLGMAASIAANVLHANHNPISQIISAWPPLALLITVELTSRIPMYRRGLAVIRVLATAVIAGIAAWVSYWHMQDVALRFGETRISAYLLPVSVDGLIVIASVSLVELAGRIRVVSEPAVADQQAQTIAAQAVVAAPVVAPALVAPVAVAPAAPVYAPPVAPAPQPVAVNAPTSLVDDLDDELEALDESTPLAAGGAPHGSVRTPRSAPVSPAVGPVVARTAAAVSAPARTVVTESTAPRPRRPASETAQLADAIEAMQPGISEDELAARLNVSVSRLRTVRREEAARRASLTQ